MNAKVDTTTLNTAPQSQGANWKDPKRYLWLLSPALPVIGLAAVSAYAVAPKKLRALSWAGPALVHGIIPALDRLIGTDTTNPPEEVIEKLENDKYYQWIVKAFIPAQYATLALATWLTGRRKDMPLMDYVGLTLTVGAVNGVAINTGHELSHKHDATDRFFSMLALAPTGYTHFAVEHPFGHHKRVATPEDPASSRMGETFWQFLPRTVIGGFKSAYEIEKRRLERKGKSFWCLENELLQGWAMSAGLFGALTVFGGPRAVPFLVGQAAYGASLLEVINYIEHYGLQRQKDAKGRYERTRPEHSWNSNEIVSNLFLYQLQRHSDHHAHPTRSFQALRHFDNTPQLPGGYASLLLPAYFPSWWFGMMDHRVVDHYKGDLSRINMQPEAREAIYARFGRPAALADDPAESLPNMVAADALTVGEESKA